MYFVMCLLARGGSTQDGLELTPSRALAGRPFRDPSLAGYHANMTSRTIDIKALFQLYNCKPGPGARVFRRNALQLFSKTDARGWSLADCLERRDEGAVLPGEDPYQGAPVPGVPVWKLRSRVLEEMWKPCAGLDHKTTGRMGRPARCAEEGPPRDRRQVLVETPP